MIPNPKTKLITGNLSDINPNSIIQSLIKIAKNYDGIYKLSFPNREIIIVSSQELVDELCNEKRFDKTLPPPILTLKEVAGDGLFTSYTHEPNWGKAHRLLTPVFGPLAIQEMLPKMIDIAEQLMLKLERQYQDKSFNVSSEMTRLTLDTIALCAFDYRFNSFYDTQMHPFVQAMVDILEESGKKNLRLPLQQKLMFLKNKKYTNNIKFLNDTADEVIAKRRANPNNNNDLLNVMLNNFDPLTGEKLDDENIRNQLITFLVAGHETTSGLLSFTIYLLLKNPESLNKLKIELDEVLKNEKPQKHHLSKLTYLEKVLKESLRLYPTASAFSVTPLNDTIIGGKYNVKKDQTILILPWMLHRDKKVWGENSELFNPERFEHENFIKLPPNSWKPFGNGQRACIGMSFAMQESILVLAMLFQRFEVCESDPNYELKINESLTIKPKDFYIKIRKRSNYFEPKFDKVSIENITNIKSISTNSFNETLLILYGSNSGASEGFAKKLFGKCMSSGFKVNLGELDNYINKLNEFKFVFIITASYDGKPTYNATKFINWLEFSKISLSGIKYAVLGCGHTDWVNTYQAVPIKINNLFNLYGAEQFLDRAEANAAGDFIGDYEKWEDSILSKLNNLIGNQNYSTENKSFLSAELVDSKTMQLRQFENKYNIGTVLVNKDLVKINEFNSSLKKHMEISIPSSISYETGDYLSILPSNSIKIINRILTRFNLKSDSQIIIRSGNSYKIHFPTDYPIYIIDILKYYVELSQPVTKKQIGILANHCICPPEKNELLVLMENNVYLIDVIPKRISVLDLLEKYSSIILPIHHFLEMLPVLKPRLYSISSSPLNDSGRLSITYGVINEKSWSGNENFEGVASNYLSELVTGSKINFTIQKSSNAFHLPHDLNRPIIMICAGTGIAPFRGFIQERSILNKKKLNVGVMHLFFGCRHPEIDYLYQEELIEWQNQGVVSIHTAFSRVNNDEIIYVQHRLWDERVLVWDMLEKNAKIYVCGSGKYLVSAVKNTFLNIYKDKKKCTNELAEKWLNEMQKDGKNFVTDVFN